MMTPDELAAIVSGIAPVIRDYVTRVHGELVQRVTIAETQLAAVVTQTTAVGLLRERVAVLETRALVPGPPGPAGRDGVEDLTVRTAVGDLVTRVGVIDTQLAGVVGAVPEIGAMRERLAVLETRAPVPGPPGPAGRDGVDGLGFEDLGVTQRDDRSFTIAAMRGERVQEIGTARFAVEIYRGVWTEGKTYEPGDGVTWAGSEWHCQTTTTTKPGDGSKAWTLKVKRGRDGKDGTDGPPGPPGPAGRDWQQVYDDVRRR